MQAASDAAAKIVSAVFYSWKRISLGVSMKYLIEFSVNRK